MLSLGTINARIGRTRSLEGGLFQKAGAAHGYELSGIVLPIKLSSDMPKASAMFTAVWREGFLVTPDSIFK